MTSVREQWEERARNFGASCHGVLFKGLSEPANAMLDAWHKRLVREVFEPAVPRRSVVLDIGCGYGRLATVLAQDRPDILPIGQDISLRYCSMLAASGGVAVQAEQARLPIRASSLGGALAVTALMYEDRDAVIGVLRQIREALVPGAPLLILDPGEELRSIIERTGGRRVATATGGRGFRKHEYRRLAMDAGFRIIRQGGNPRDSVLVLLTMGGKIGWRCARRMLPRDGVDGYSVLALHRWLLLNAPDPNRHAEPVQ